MRTRTKASVWRCGLSERSPLCPARPPPTFSFRRPTRQVELVVDDDDVGRVLDVVATPSRLHRLARVVHVGLGEGQRDPRGRRCVTSAVRARSFCDSFRRSPWRRASRPRPRRPCCGGSGRTPRPGCPARRRGRPPSLCRTTRWRRPRPRRHRRPGRLRPLPRPRPPRRPAPPRRRHRRRRPRRVSASTAAVTPGGSTRSPTRTTSPTTRSVMSTVMWVGMSAGVVTTASVCRECSSTPLSDCSCWPRPRARWARRR